MARKHKFTTDFVSRHERTPAYENAIKALTVLAAEEPDSDVVTRAYAEVMVHAVERWLREDGGLKPSTAFYPSLRRVVGKTPSRLHDEEEIEAGGVPNKLKFFDHTRLLRDSKNKRYVLLTEPYGLCSEDIIELANAIARYGLDVDVGRWPSLHFPGRTVAIVIKAKKT